MVYPGQLHYSDFQVPILKRPIDDPGRKLRVVCVGAGISGITSAIRFNQHLGDNITFQIYEKNHDVGGVWLENRYPGVACDVPAPCFTFLFEDNPNWSSYYASGKEINDYITSIADKYQVRKYVKFNNIVKRADWNELDGTWKLCIHDQTSGQMIEDEADILLLGWGQLNNWEFPNVPGLHDFKGPYMHSANYDETFDPTGKTVAIVGGGSTGVQVLPEVQKVAKQAHQYMRSKNWIAPVGFGAGELEKRGALKDGNFKYSKDERRDWSKDPDTYHSYRRYIEEGMMAYMSEEGFKYGTEVQQKMEAEFREHMKQALKVRPEILETLLPDFPPGCRRLVPGPGYLEAVVKDNVHWIPQEIECVKENGIMTKDGRLHECDAIIWATGFICDFRSRFPVVGRDSITWDQVMDPEPEAYLGCMVDKMPNCFLYLGPNAAPGAGNAYLCAEIECSHAIKCAKKMLREKIKSICVRSERVKQYVAHTQQYLKGTIFGQPCKCWFKRGDPNGRNIAYYPGNSLNQMIALDNTRWEDFEYTYLDELNGNPMGWLANGYTLADYDGSSRTTYLDPTNIDYPPVPQANLPNSNGPLRSVEDPKKGVLVHDEKVDVATTIDLIIPAAAI
ncbi:Fc.00g056960.m01.CDS01 [Cosmosporella sp. VM-42]